MKWQTMKCWLLSLMAILMACGNAHSQARLVWEQPTVLLDSIWFPKCLLDGEGHLYIGGIAFPTGFQQRGDLRLIKFNTDGARLWQQTWSSPRDFDSDFLNNFTFDQAGNIVLTGRTPNEAVTQKYTSDGAFLWSRLYSDDRSDSVDTGYGIAVDSQNNVVITGLRFIFGPMDQNILLLLKYTPDGNQLWAREFKVPDNSTNGYWVNVDSQDNIYVVGTLYNSSDVLALKYSPDGTLLWQYRYDDPRGRGWDDWQGAWLDSQSNLYLTLTSYPGTVTIKLDSQGNEVWKQIYNGSNYTVDLAVDEVAGQVYVFGGLDQASYNASCTYEVLIAYDTASGHSLWESYLTLPDADIRQPRFIRLDQRGRIYLLGLTYRQTLGDRRAVDPRHLVHRFDRNGQELGVYYHPTILWGGEDMAVGDYGEVYLASEHTLKLIFSATRAEGDVTGDGMVNDWDLAEVIFKFGSTNLAADVDGDGKVDYQDLTTVIDNFGLGNL